MEAQIIRARVGEPVEIKRVAAGFGGGYLWRARLLNDSGATLIEVDTSKASPGGDPIPGSPPAQVFVFQSTTPGIEMLELSYGRPWEAASVKTEIVRIEVS